uniref:Uncharacterized protein n=1 Tax=Physcomitrium patens TaxID=3218 RepID=A0A2K1IWR7_PHYPA|nr:hypothetical protein PHYPA_023543 [Physcomitrium patens]
MGLPWVSTPCNYITNACHRFFLSRRLASILVPMTRFDGSSTLLLLMFGTVNRVASELVYRAGCRRGAPHGRTPWNTSHR